MKEERGGVVEERSMKYSPVLEMNPDEAGANENTTLI